jgi:hypothetical protein
LRIHCKKKKKKKKKKKSGLRFYSDFSITNRKNQRALSDGSFFVLLCCNPSIDLVLIIDDRFVRRGFRDLSTGGYTENGRSVPWTRRNLITL